MESYLSHGRGMLPLGVAIENTGAAQMGDDALIAAVGDGLGTVVGAALLIFIILLITDILGVTDVFSFVKSK